MRFCAASGLKKPSLPKKYSRRKRSEKLSALNLWISAGESNWNKIRSRNNKPRQPHRITVKIKLTGCIPSIQCGHGSDQGAKGRRRNTSPHQHTSSFHPFQRMQLPLSLQHFLNLINDRRQRRSRVFIVSVEESRSSVDSSRTCFQVEHQSGTKLNGQTMSRHVLQVLSNMFLESLNL